MSAADEWTLTFTFKAEDVDAVGILREALHGIVENFRGISDVDVDGTHPDHFGWANLSGRPGDGQFIDLRERETVVTSGGAL